MRIYRSIFIQATFEVLTQGIKNLSFESMYSVLYSVQRIRM